jgi:cell division protein FtsI/penicillin-binding protein 2
MERITRFRVKLLLIFFSALVLFFAFKLYQLQVVETGGKTDNTTTFTTYTRVKASRCHILDTNGNVLVSNRASYDMMLNHYVLITADGTQQLPLQSKQSVAHAILDKAMTL